MSKTAQKIYGVLLALLAIATLVTGIYSIRNQERIARCQSHFNEQFVGQLRVRNDISTSDRESLANTVKGLLQQGMTPERKKKLLETYLKTKEENDAKRAKHPLPELPEVAAC